MADPGGNWSLTQNPEENRRPPTTTNPSTDPQTGRNWGIDEDGFDHNQPHAPNDWCREPCGDTGCGRCRGYNCGPFAATREQEKPR